MHLGPLPDPESRLGSFLVSVVLVTTALASFILLTAAVHKVEKQKYIEHMVFTETTPPPPPPKIVTPKVKMFAPPQPEVVKIEPPKIVVPKIEPPEMSKPVKIDVEQPKLPPAAPKAVAPPPQPEVGLFASAKPTPTANNKAPATVEAGGFGDPIGAKPNPNLNQSQTVAVGSFNSAPGSPAGAGASRKGAVGGTSFGSDVANGVPGGRDMGKVASAGFANGVVGSTGKPGGTGTVASAGFNSGAPPNQVAIKTSEPAFIPPVVISEPHPQYTPEAAQLKIQGEVTLQVRFAATGHVEILRVINGLGHGLDEQAKRVAEQIRFKPAEKDGHPVDHTTLIHVTFQLANGNPNTAQNQKNSETPNAGKQPRTERLERYPMLDCPDDVPPDREFAVQVSLTEKLVTPEAHVEQGESTPEGKLIMRLPENKERSWKLDVVLAAPGLQFTRLGTNISTITLPAQGDATSAVFYVRARPDLMPGAKIHVLASYWYQGRYLARISRDLRVLSVEPTVASVALVTRREVKSFGAITDAPAEFEEGNLQPDLTLVISGDGVTLSSRYLQPTTGKLKDSVGFTHWLAQNSMNLARAGRGSELAPGNDAPNSEIAEGFGILLYQNYAPDVFKRAFWTLNDKLHERFRTIQIYSDDPQIPWELMRPVRDDGTDTQTFLGLSHSVARWHVTSDGIQREQPPSSEVLQKMVVIAPHYSGVRSLDGEAEEAEGLAKLERYSAVAGNMKAVRSLFRDPPQGIIHFAGHGELSEAGGDFAILLEDGELDTTTWRGLARPATASHTFFFFNACDVGQSKQAGNFVDGWAPAVLGAGASGYIGALWPVNDQIAAKFAVRFYQLLQEEMRIGPAEVSATLQRTRREIYNETNNPTALAYVLYADTNLRFTK